MIEIVQTETFSNWLSGLRDRRAQGAIIGRLNRAALGNFGDVAPVGDGVSEMRIDVGAGYRAYFKRSGLVVVIILCGGDKSTQRRDIARAKQIARDIGL